MSNWKVGPGGRLYHPTTGEYAGQLDANGNEQLVVSIATSLDGRIGFSAPTFKKGIIADALQGLGCIGRRIFHARCGAFDNTTTQTFLAVFEVPADFDMARPVLVNSGTSTYAVASVTGVVLTSAADLNGNGLIWTDGKFNGATSGVVPAAASATRRAFLRPDWLQISNYGVGTKLVAFRVEVTTAASINIMGNGSSDTFTNWATRTDGNLVAFRNMAGSFATNATRAGFTTTTNRNQSPICGVEVACRGKVLNYAAFGDSNDAGRTTYIGEGYVLPLARKLTDDLGIPVFLSNLAWSGQLSGQIADNIGDTLAAGLVPDLASFPAGSINDYTADTITAASVAYSRVNMAKSLAALSAYNVRTFMRTVHPVNPSVANHNHGATDALRRAWIAEVMDSYRANGYPVADFDTPVAGITDANGQVNPAVGTMGDGIHYNDYGASLILPGAEAAALSALAIAA